MFQVLKALRELNLRGLHINIKAIDVVMLTHGYMNYVGYLSRLIKQGFTGKLIEQLQPTRI